MFKFFRRIRFDLMEKNKTGKPAYRTGRYLKYAIGEIILVVIGILIALQINNWNEQSKQRIEEVRLLEKVSIDLINDINQLEGHISEATIRQAIVDSIFTFLHKDPSSDPMKFLRFNFIAILTENHFEVNSGTFDESQSAGSIKFIQNDSLRQQIFNYYRNTKRNYDDENTVQSLYRDIFPIMFNKIIATKEFILRHNGTESNLPELDIAALSKDQDYMAILLQKEISEEYQIESWKSFLQNAESLVQQIQSNQNEKDPH
jgi:hypothetical protein